MITRFEIIDCPKCGHSGFPKVTNDTGRLASMVPVLGDVQDLKNVFRRTLNCEKCGHPFTEAVKDKLAKRFGLK